MSPNRKKKDLFSSGKRKTSVETRFEAEEELRDLEDGLIKDLKDKAVKKSSKRKKPNR